MATSSVDDNPGPLTVQSVNLAGDRMAYRAWGTATDQPFAVAATNPLIEAVTVPEADHNIHRGRFDAFMAEVDSFLNRPD